MLILQKRLFDDDDDDVGGDLSAACFLCHVTKGL